MIKAEEQSCLFAIILQLLISLLYVTVHLGKNNFVFVEHDFKTKQNMRL